MRFLLFFDAFLHTLIFGLKIGVEKSRGKIGKKLKKFYRRDRGECREENVKIIDRGLRGFSRIVKMGKKEKVDHEGHEEHEERK